MAPITNIFTIDLEEYFHPTEVQRVLPADRWASLSSRLEPQTDWVLELLDRHSARATFFVLGWVAERYPSLIRRIAAAGHEIGCHSYAHQPVYDLTPEQFRRDAVRALEAIHSAIAGVASRSVRAYRRPVIPLLRDRSGRSKFSALAASGAIPAFIRSRTTATEFPGSHVTLTSFRRPRPHFWRFPSQLRGSRTTR